VATTKLGNNHTNSHPHAQSPLKPLLYLVVSLCTQRHHCRVHWDTREDSVVASHKGFSIAAGANESSNHTDSIYHTTPQYSTIYHTTPQYSTIYHTTSQYSTIYHTTPQYSTIYHSITQYITVYHSITQYITVYHSIYKQYTTVYCCKTVRDSS